MNNSLSNNQRILKRIFDICFSCLALLLIGWLIVLLVILSRLITQKNGIFKQERVGLYANKFTIYKVRSLPDNGQEGEFPLGIFLRRFKLDELPQFYNVLKGDMSIVGPRPDLPGYADKLEGKYQEILSVRPGITGPASIKFKNEEELLAKQKEPKKYNDEILWPQKVKINYQYVKEYSFLKDMSYIVKTIFK